MDRKKNSSVTFLFLIAAHACIAASTESSTAFDTAIAKIYAKKPHLQTLADDLQEQEAHERYKLICNTIDWAALMSLSIRIYIKHFTIVKSDLPNIDMLDKALKFGPEFIQRMCKQSRFFSESVDITLQTIIARTLAHMIAYCTVGKGIRFIKNCIRSTKELIYG